MTKNKAASAIALLMILAMIVTLAVPFVNAQPIYPTYAFLGVTPNPVGVGQTVLLHIGISQQTMGTTQFWYGLTVTVTRPDGTTETLGPFTTDSTGGTGSNYIPNQVGVYKFQTHFPAQNITGFDFATFSIVNKGYAASDSPITELVVQEEAIPYFPGFPLPTEYWTRPINGQFWEWAPLTGNWLWPTGSYTMPPVIKYHEGNSEAPETAHILWTKVYAQGGITGIDLPSQRGYADYEMGDAYVGKFLNSVVIDGVLYYNRYQETGGSAVTQEVVAVNLKTGEEVWVKNWNNARLEFGQVYNFQSFNYYGAFAYLWTVTGNTWDAYDACTGRWVYRLTDVPSGYRVYGPKGEIYVYTVNTAAGWMTEWNSSKATNPQNTGSVGDGSWDIVGQTINATQGYDWNVTIPLGLPGAVCHYSFNDCILGSESSAFPSFTGPSITSWALSTKKETAGNLTFKTTWTVPTDLALATWVWTDVSFEDRVFIISCKESLRFYGFNLDNGNYMWQTEQESYLQYYDKWYGPMCAYGNFYSERMSGTVICYDIKTGQIKWTFNVTDPYAEILWSQNFPTFFNFATDGKIYLCYGEHSPNLQSRGAPMLCLDAETGEEIWRISWFGNWWGGYNVIGDSIMAGLNAGYDNRLYAFGKGPSATSIEASPKLSVHGDEILVEGVITDISPGTSEYALTARFPDGVPVVGDESMTDWMQYVYMQYPRPADVTGVGVSISVIDPNNNVYEVATATTGENGFYSTTFTPEVPGKYTVMAMFAGTKSYVGSYAQTAINVGAAPEPTVAPTQAPASMADLYFLPVSIVLIIAIVIVLVLMLLLFRKR
jgi:outer membrane protein assembly factor BamB